jgi:type IV pilus modification protein PilV
MRRAAGFSLVEVMCAILVLGIGLAGLTQGLSTALTSSKESEVQTQAALIASAMIEQLRAETYLTDGETEGGCGKALPLYRWRQKIAPADVEGLHEVTVTVERAKTGQALFELRTLLFEAPADSTSDTSKSRPKDEGKKGRNDKAKGGRK